MEFVLLAALLAILPWGYVMLSKARLLPLAALVVCVGTVFGPPFFSVQAGIQLSIDRMLLLLAVALAGVRVVRGELKLPKLQHIDYLIALFAAWLLFSAVRSEPHAGGESPVSRWLAFVATPLALYGLARITKLERRDCRFVLGAFVALGVYLGLTGVFEVAQLYALVFPRHISDPSYWEFLGRARGPLLNPIGNGILLTTCLAAATVCFLQSPRKQQLGYGLAICIIGVGVVCTLTRSVWMGALLLALVVAVLYFWNYVPAAGALGLGAILLLVSVGPSVNLLEYKRDQNLSAAEARKSIELRPILAQVAWEMFQDKPVEGHGYGSYLRTAQPYLASRSQEASFDLVRPYIQHNVILSLLVESGAIAVSLLMAVLGFVSFHAWKLCGPTSRTSEQRAIGLLTFAVVGAYFVNGMFHDVSVIPMTNHCLLFLAGLCVSARNVSFAPTRATDLPQAAIRPATGKDGCVEQEAFEPAIHVEAERVTTSSTLTP